MHILFLTDNFPPEVNAPASRTFEHCRQWVRDGHQVTVITCAPNFPKGQVFDGYRNRLWQTEEMEGIK
ncbi:MAG: glycosyltransferase WbuB, partial [Pseudomonadota bacterium]